jgi:DNA polymerase III epsilon subunit-like protein
MRAVVFDTETTGLIENHTLRLSMQPEVIEFAAVAVDWDALEVVAEVSHLIRPRLVNSLPDETVKRTQIIDEDLAGKPFFSELAASIKIELENADAVVGHNLAFDMEMIDIEFERIRDAVDWPGVRICTIEQSSHYVGHRLNLTGLLRALTGRDHTNAHRALDDARATAAILIEMRRRDWL